MTAQSERFQAHPYYLDSREPGKARQANPQQWNGLQLHVMRHHDMAEEIAKTASVHDLAVSHSAERHSHR